MCVCTSVFILGMLVSEVCKWCLTSAFLNFIWSYIMLLQLGKFYTSDKILFLPFWIFHVIFFDVLTLLNYYLMSKFCWNKMDHAVTQVLCASLSQLRHGLNPRLVYMGFVVYKVALGQDFLQVLWLFLVSIIPPVLHTHVLYVTNDNIMLKVDSIVK